MTAILNNLPLKGPVRFNPRSAWARGLVCAYLDYHNRADPVGNGGSLQQSASYIGPEKGGFDTRMGGGYFTAPVQNLPSNEYTVAFWGNIRDSSGTGILSLSNGSSGTRHLVWTQGGDLKVWTGRATQVIVSGNFPEDEMAHFVITYSGTVGDNRAFFDGVEASAYDVQDLANTKSNTTLTLNNRYDLSTTFDGDNELYDVRIYDRLFTPEEALGLYQSRHDIYEPAWPIYIPKAAAAGGFQSAWARGSNSILGGFNP